MKPLSSFFDFLIHKKSRSHDLLFFYRYSQPMRPTLRLTFSMVRLVIRDAFSAPSR